MTDTMQPLLRELYDADGDRARAGVLLRMPDSLMLKYHDIIDAACRKAGFEVGWHYLAIRVSLALAVRDADGLPPVDLSIAWENYRRAMVEFAGGRHG